MESTPATAAPGLRPADSAVVTLLCLLLPAGFRDRQRGEWTGDLLSMAHQDPAARRRYLIGAVRTLPSLRGAISRRDTPPVEMPAGVRATLAHILLLGMTWPILSWLFWVPARYLAFAIPSSIESGEPDSSWMLWPRVGTPNWLQPLWNVTEFSAFVVHISGPILLAAVGVIGTALAGLRHRRRRVHRLTAAITAAAVVLVTGAWTIAMRDPLIDDDGYTAGLLGIAAIVLAITTAGLSKRTRVGLLMLGAGAIILFLSFHTAGGIQMGNWFWD
jgi:hypothetical protein